MSPPDTILIEELEVYCRVGVPAAERARPQRLLVSVVMRKDTRAAAASDDLTQTIDYYAVSERLKAMAQGREWKLIETLAAAIAELVLWEFGAEAAEVEVKKFVLRDARHVAVRIARRAGPCDAATADALP